MLGKEGGLEGENPRFESREVLFLQRDLHSRTKFEILL